MLTRLFIQNFVLIDQADIAFGKGLCVLTGETGAGKSILLDALSLPLGARAESKMVRNGASQATVIVEFDIAGYDSPKAILSDLGLDTDDTLIMRRVLTDDGKSRGFVNDQPVSIAALKQLGDALLEIHGQFDQRGLLNPSTHQSVLDEYGAHEKQVKEVETAFHAWKVSTDALAQFKEQMNALITEMDYLKHVYGELKSLNPVAGEEQQLADKRSAMMNHEKLHQVISDSLGQLSGQYAVSANINAAERILTRTSLGQNNQFSEIIEALQKAEHELQVAVDALEKIRDESVYDAHQLERIEERLFALRGAARKHQVSVDELPGILEVMSTKVKSIDTQDIREKQLAAQVESTRKVFFAAAQQLRAMRQKTATKLQKSVQKELEPLKMASTQFQVVLVELEEKNWNANGIDSITFEASTNKGMAAGALHKIASGGELSRFMLALKVVLAGVKTTPSLIFDEIDTGTGGAVADAIGQRLAALGKAHQVFVVTHLPQVAACGAHHFLVSKSEKNKQTFTRIEELNELQREEEIARMLAGAEITTEARKAAVKLLKAAG